MSFKDVTHGVERMEMLEERMGIRLQGLMATVANEMAHDGTHELEVNGEIYSTSGGALDQALELQVVAQNEKGQVIGVSMIYLSEDSFAGYEALSETVYCKAFPTRVKIVPKRA